jgi:hypothetical protein
MRFTAKTHLTETAASLPPIKVTIGFDSSQVVFRISDHGGGIPKDIHDNIFSWTHSAQRNMERLQDVTQLAGKVDENSYFTVSYPKTDTVGTWHAHVAVLHQLLGWHYLPVYYARLRDGFLRYAFDCESPGAT